MSSTEQLVVVGGGECGTRAAFAAREQGWNGEIVLIAAESGLPYERPPLSKTVLSSPISKEPTKICTERALRDAHITLLRNSLATNVNRAQHHVELADQRTIRYDRLLLATGALPRRLPELDAVGAHYLRSYSDAARLRACLLPGVRVGIVGAGFVGLEVAASARKRGCDVTVIETANQAMGRVVPSAVADIVVARHRAEGVRVLLGTSIVSIERLSSQVKLGTSDGDDVVCDVLVASVGALASVELASRAGLEIENGVRVDATLRTSDGDIYAAGDCCSFPSALYENSRLRMECWRSAHAQAQLVAGNLLGGQRKFVAVPSTWSDQYDLTLEVVGLPGVGVRHAVRRRMDGVELHFALSNDGRLVAASAVSSGSAATKDLRLAERLIAQSRRPGEGALMDASASLKALAGGMTADIASSG